MSLTARTTVYDALVERYPPKPADGGSGLAERALVRVGDTDLQQLLDQGLRLCGRSWQRGVVGLDQPAEGGTEPLKRQQRVRAGRPATVAALDGQRDKTDQHVCDVRRDVGGRRPYRPPRSAVGLGGHTHARDGPASAQAANVVPPHTPRAVPQHVRLGVVHIVHLAVVLVADTFALLSCTTQSDARVVRCGSVGYVRSQS